MSDTTEQFRSEMDRLDTGLPETPQIDQIRSQGTRLRRRRRARVSVLAGAGAAALALPLLSLVGGSGTPTAQDVPAAQQPAPAAPAAPLASAAGPAFGPGMRAAVADAFPAAEHTGGAKGDRWVWEDHEVLDWEVGSPPRWSTLFAWARHYDLASGRPLDVIATREPPAPVLDPASYGYCRDDLFVTEAECRTWEVSGRTVVLHDGTQARGQSADSWNRSVEVWGAGGTAEMVAKTEVVTLGTGDTWAEARADLPTVQQMVDLALDERLILPEPERYPRQFPANRPAQP